jgi:hypothetical protein
MVSRQQADFIRNNENKNIWKVGQKEVQNGRHGLLNFCGDQGL